MKFPITSSSVKSDIEQLQQALADQGFDITVDGVLGPLTTAAVVEFQTDSGLTADGIVGPVTWAKLTVVEAAVEAVAEAGPIAGFDTFAYPGDSAMETWKKSSPYRFVGYYLKAPCHSNDTWTGKRAKIVSLGWNIVVIYVGRQSQGPCSSVPPDNPTGVKHGQDALAKTAAEGFAPQTIIYLDVEPMDHIPQAQIDYVNGWLSQFSGASFLPGIYCHIKNASALKGAISTFPADRVAFWVSGSGHFDAGTSRPADSSIGFARMWQGTFNQTKTFGGVTLEIDENVG
jgi:hypothetical protein